MIGFVVSSPFERAVLLIKRIRGILSVRMGKLDCYVYITIRAYNKAKIMVNGGTYMVHIDNDEVESVATWEEAQENKLNGSKAASELYYQSIAGRKHYTEVDNKNQNYLLKHPYK